MHTHWCALIEISMEIGMLNFWSGLLVTALMKEIYFSNLACKSFNFIEKSDLGGRKPGLHGSTKMSTTGSINMVGILIEGSTFKGAEWNLVSHKFCLFSSSSCKSKHNFIYLGIILLISDMVVKRCNRRFGCETIHPTKKNTSMNLLQMSCVIT